jgi:hypothetical protein
MAGNLAGRIRSAIGRGKRLEAAIAAVELRLASLERATAALAEEKADRTQVQSAHSALAVSLADSAETLESISRDILAIRAQIEETAVSARTAIAATDANLAALQNEKAGRSEVAALQSALASLGEVATAADQGLADSLRRLAADKADVSAVGVWRDESARAARATSDQMAALSRSIEPMPALIADLASTQSVLADIGDRLSYSRHRWDALDKVVDYLVVAQIPGDYMEFGVYLGRTFGYALKTLGANLPDMNFVAFDSFEGLPTPHGLDAVDGYSGGFFAGQFACTEDEFRENVRQAGGDMTRVIVVPGWFEKTLAAPGPVPVAGRKVAVAWIDCDLYESAPPILDFLTNRLSVGSVILFDDWWCFRNLADLGEQRACREWLERNPGIRLNEFIDFGFGGKAFTVAACPDDGD